ncbi:hypothetical protein CQR54_1516 [Bifidobacterium pseudolongum subsp. globosum]|nr:hypothetical protein CQR54_1516 [Bifidobacterium pseudolongum subsp. globosum]
MRVGKFICDKIRLSFRWRNYIKSMRVFKMKKTRLHILLPALVAAGLLSPAPAAFGNEPAIQRSCPELGNTYVTATITNANAYVPFGSILRSGPGGTVTATQHIAYTSTVKSSVSGNISAGEIVSASISAGVSNTKSSTTGTSYTYSHPISNGKYGNLQWVNWAATVSVKKTVVVSPCNFSQIAAGTATVPRDSWGYRYWEN